MRFFRQFCTLVLVASLASTGCTPPPQTNPEPSATKGKAKSGLKPYGQLITDQAQTDEGLFRVHQVDNKYYFEIPDSLLQRDFLLISRIAGLPAGLGGGYVNAGSKTNEQLVVWEKFEDKLLLKSKSYNAYAADSLPIYLSVQANNFQPTIYAFSIAALSPDSAGYLIEVSKFFSSDVPAISGLSPALRKGYKVSKLDSDRSFVRSLKSFPLNLEVRQELTYQASEPPSSSNTGSISLLMNQSLVLLPKEPMMPRLSDYRLGYFTVKQIDYGSGALKSDEKSFIRRWRLEPKDPEAYHRGELVEPVKPIEYYLDPATPESLRPYIRDGVLQWQGVFESAGFKNAILVKDPPSAEEDPDFSPEDVRYSVIRYVASTTRNAMGPSVSDPRSGEIIESDIIWYHNHLRSYRNRYLLETGAANPSARSLNTPEADIGEMMLQVITHEVGHALGLPHNMRASYAYPVDSLRSGSFTQRMGIAASVMDYARYNYVAQPGDEGVRFVRQIGPYDHYAINWGYRLIPEASTPEEEVPVLSRWIEERADDPLYAFGSGYGRFDPASQTEGIGNDALKASSYGLANLKRVAPQLLNWTAGETNEYNDLEELYGELLGVWSRYIGHVLTHLGGVYENRIKPVQEGYVYTPVAAEVQREALDWLLENAFSSPDWLNRSEIARNVAHANHLESMRRLQERQLNNLLDFSRLARLMENEVLGIDYNALDMVQQLQRGIWQEVYRGQPIDIFRRNLQKAYLERMDYLLNDTKAQDQAALNRYSTRVAVGQSDIRSIVRGELMQLQRQLQRSRNRYNQPLQRYHLDDALSRIQTILDREQEG